MAVNGAINGELFLAYVEQILLPTLHKGDIVVRDNLSSYKMVGVKKAIVSAGAKVLYLPPYRAYSKLVRTEFAHKSRESGYFSVQSDF